MNNPALYTAGPKMLYKLLIGEPEFSGHLPEEFPGLTERKRDASQERRGIFITTQNTVKYQKGLIHHQKEEFPITAAP